VGCSAASRHKEAGFAGENSYSSEYVDARKSGTLLQLDLDMTNVNTPIILQKSN